MHASTLRSAVLRAALRARLPLLVLLLGASAASWWLLRAGPAPPLRAEGGDPSRALSAWLEAHEGLLAESGQVGLIDDPASRGWTEALDWTPGFALAHPPAVEGGVELEDLYYFEVRLARDGTPVELRRLTNLTATPQARERLVARDGVGHALLSVDVYGKLESLLLVDFKRDERPLPEGKGRADRLRSAITNLQESGRADGIGLRLYRLDPPAEGVEAGFEGGVAAVTLRSGAGAGERFRLDGGTGEVSAVEGAALSRVVHQPRFRANKQFVPWLVDTVRDLSFVGPKKIAVLEQFAFQWSDQAHQWAFAAGMIEEEGGLVEELGAEVIASAPTLDSSAAGFDAEWPPPVVTSGVPDPKPGEGHWTPFQIDWLRTLPGAPPAFMKTAVRMDPTRPYQIVVLIAMDMRQLDLGLVAGTQTPESSFGKPGDGLIPRRQEVIDRLVGAFNGGFKTAHGAFGMGVDHSVVLPAMPFAATVTVHDDDQVRLGTWNNSMNVPDDVRSFRQNLPPLVAGGKLNPTGKRKWGGTASDLDGVNTERSGLCYRGRNTLIYAWGQGMSADSLGKAMIAAGCEFGMHLDMNPTHTGWSFYRIEWTDVQPNGEVRELLSERGGKTMDFRTERYAERDVKDFFYLTLRRTLREVLPAPPAGFSAWSASHAPAGDEGFLEVAATSAGPDGALLVAVDLRRQVARLQRGSREPLPGATPGSTTVIEPLRLASPTLLIDLGVITEASPLGFKVGDLTLAAPVEGQAALVRDAEGGLRLLSPEAARGLDLTTVADLRGGVALLVDGQPRPVKPSAPPGGALHVLATDDAGRLFVLSSAAAPDVLAGQLQQLGARQALLLPASVRASRATPVRFLQVQEGALRELDPVTGAVAPLTDARAATTTLYLERVPAPPRVAGLDLPPVELSADESKRQKKLLGQIMSMREQLRDVENTKYNEWIEKQRAKREAKGQ